MIITRLIGGLGNQMFQYATGRSLAHKLNTELKLDISGFERYTLRRYELSPFNIVENFATNDDICATKYRARSLAVRIIDKISNKSPHPGKFYFREKRLFHFDSAVLDLSDGFYLEGSWQSPLYFQNIEDVIRKDFTLKGALSEASLNVESKIKSCNSFSLHIRRGDYVQNPETNKVHGVCDMRYYEDAVEYLLERFDNLYCFIFSDEPDWAKDNLRLPCPVTVVGHNGQNKDYEDMILLSCCTHHIIANSTFSWWGAWLGNAPDKIVVAPKKWTNAPEYDVKNLIPGGWVQL